MADKVHTALIARALLGRAEPRFSDSKHLRYGMSGNLSVNVETGRFYDNDTDDGGDIVDLVRSMKGFENGQAEAWIADLVRKEQERTPAIDLELPDSADSMRDLAAERDVIGSLILQPDLYGVVCEELQAEHLSEPLHADLYLTLGDMVMKDERITLGALINSIGGDNGEDVVPGFRLKEYVARLMADVAPKFSERAREVSQHLRTLYDTRMRTVDEYDQAVEREQAAAKAKFKLRAFNDVLLTQFEPSLVRGVLPSSGLVVVWGPPKCGKSFWTFDICMHIALGWPYRGRKVKQGPVVYFVLEGEAGYGARVEAFRSKFIPRNYQHIPFYDVVTRLDLIREHQQLIKDLRAQLGDVMPAVITLDTLNRSLVGSEVNDEDMGAYIKAADAIREAFGCVVIVVHHCGIAGERPRGHTSLTGAADAQLAVRRDEQKNVVVKVEWLKDGTDGDTLTSRLEKVIVGKEPDGFPISSCVIVDEEGQGAAIGFNANLKELKLVRAIIEATDVHGVSPSTIAGLNLPTSIERVVESKYVREIYYKTAGFTGEEDAIRSEQATKTEMKTAGKVLEKGGVIATYNPTKSLQYIWWTKKPVKGLAMKQVEEKPQDALPLDIEEFK